MTHESHSLAPTEFFNEILLDQMPVGIVVLDRHGYVVKYNRFEEQLARRTREQVVGRHFFTDVAVCTDVAEIRGRFEEHIDSNTLSSELDFAFLLPFLPQPRDVRLRMRSFAVGDGIFGVIVVEDIGITKELERQRQRLLNIMVHDLKNPLMGVLGYASLLKSTGLEGMPRPEVMKALSVIEESAKNMSQMLTDTLAEMHGERRDFAAVNLHALVLSALSNMLPVATERGVELVYGGRLMNRPDFPDRALVVEGRVEVLASMVQNLVSNAVKYADGRVSVELEQRGDRLMLDVSDDGPGIAESDQSKIFERGYQGRSSLPGAGIGLFSVKRAVDLHLGQVQLRSQLGDGTRFRVELPVEAPDPA